MPSDQENPSLDYAMSCAPSLYPDIRAVGMISVYPLQCTSVWPMYANVYGAESQESQLLLPFEPQLSTNPMDVSRAVAVIESVLGKERSSTSFIPMVKTFVNGLKRRFADTHLAMFLTDVWNWIGTTAISLITKPKE